MRNFFQAELPYVSSAAFLVTGLFALFVWLRSRRETLYLLFFAMTLVTFLRMMHNYVGLDRLPVSDAWFGWVTVDRRPVDAALPPCSCCVSTAIPRRG